jgi:signal transduction histidine kinase
MLLFKITSNIKKEDIKFFEITQFAYLFAAVVHLIFIFIFYFINIYEMVLVNIFLSVPIFLSSFFLNRKGKLNLAFLLVSIEFLVHQIFAIYYIGWESGFQYFLIYLSVLVYFNPNWERSKQFFFSASALVVFLTMYILYKDNHIYSLTNEIYEYLYISSVSTTALAIILLVNFFVKIAYRGEVELEKLIKERTKELEQSQKDAISMLGEAGHFNDNDTGVHIWRMADYSALLGKKIGMKNKEVELLRLAAPMHDSGKIGIPDYILKKPAKLEIHPSE